MTKLRLIAIMTMCTFFSGPPVWAGSYVAPDGHLVSYEGTDENTIQKERLQFYDDYKAKEAAGESGFMERTLSNGEYMSVHYGKETPINVIKKKLPLIVVSVIVVLGCLSALIPKFIPNSSDQ